MKFKVLQFGKAFPPVNLGGVEIVIQNLHNGLNRRNIKCDSLGVNGNHSFKIDEGSFGGKIYRSKRLAKVFSTLISIHQIFLFKKIKGEYDLIHYHHPDPMAGLCLFLSRPDSPIITHWHSDIIRQKVLLIFYAPILKWILARSKVIICTSSNYANHSTFLKKYLNKVEIVPIGIDIDPKSYDVQFHDELKKRFIDKVMLCSVGRLNYYKGYEYLIRSIKNLPSNVVLVIVGEGELKKDLIKLVERLDLKNRIHFLGKLNEERKHSVFEACNIFILASTYKTEAFGISQVEAMAHGKPIISTKIEGSGVDWVNLDNYSGLTVPIKNSLAISNAIKKIIDNPSLSQSLSLGSYERYINNFTLCKMIDSTIGIYERILIQH